MNFRNILSNIFSFANPPSLEEFITAHNPTDMAHVEFLEKEYDRIYGPVFNYPVGR